MNWMTPIFPFLILSQAVIMAYHTSFLPRRTFFLPSIPSCENDDYKCHRTANTISMKVSKGKSKTSRSKGCTIASRNQERMKVAGRRGTKRFVDPNKLFIGNLSYQVTESDLTSFLRDNGIPDAHVNSLKIIRDWRTGESKGYGFVQFTDPIFATSALELIRNKELQGRIVRFDQGKKKDADPIVIVKKTRQEDIVTEEDAALADAIAEVEEFDVDNLLVDGYDDKELFPDFDDDADDEFEYDGVYEEEYLMPLEGEEEMNNMNREQRREAEKRRKKRKIQGKGFGN